MLLRSVSALVAGCVLLIASASIAAQPQPQRGPSTPEERQQALDYIQSIQSNPLSSDVVPKREWVLRWIIEVPDIHVHICAFVDLAKGNKKHSDVLFVGMTLAQTAFAIRHLNDQPDPSAEVLAGVEGMLDAYEKVLAAYPKDHQPAVDDLVQRSKAGTLNDYVKQQAADHCKN